MTRGKAHISDAQMREWRSRAAAAIQSNSIRKRKRTRPACPIFNEASEPVSEADRAGRALIAKLLELGRSGDPAVSVGYRAIGNAKDAERKISIQRKQHEDEMRLFAEVNKPLNSTSANGSSFNFPIFSKLSRFWSTVQILFRTEYEDLRLLADLFDECISCGQFSLPLRPIEDGGI